MTAFDTIFNKCVLESNLVWYMVESLPDQTKQAAKQYRFPCVWRNFNEHVQPMFDNFQTVERDMSLYFVHIGFSKLSKERINENLDGLMNSFITFRDLMRRSGIEVTLTQKPFPNWRQTNYDEYGYVFNFTAKYSLCLTA